MIWLGLSGFCFMDKYTTRRFYRFHENNTFFKFRVYIFFHQSMKAEYL